MRSILFFILFFTISLSIQAQSTSCKNQSTVEDLLKKETTSTSGERYQALKAARFYWWRRCQCESGNVVDAAGEKAIIEYLATGYDNYKWAFGKYDDIPEPNKRDFKTGDCFKGGASTGPSSYDLNCCSESKSFVAQAKDNQQYGKAFFTAYCECRQGVSSVDRSNQLVAAMKINLKNYKAYKPSGDPSIKTVIPNGCTVTTNSSAVSSTQQQIMKMFQNYNNAMNLKNQGIGIAKAYAQQVKTYSQLNQVNSPEALLQNFNKNMQAIADLQTQNKADNLNQVINTLNSTVNDLNSGNHEGAMFSALSLIDQGEAKREARREAEAAKQELNYQAYKKMTAFYAKAVELNNQAIKQYYEKATYAFSKEEEDYLLEYVKHLECHKESMKKNFSHLSTSWTKNRCAVPVKRTYTVNNLVAKDVQYINIAKRKYVLYEKTEEPIFQQGAMRFAGLAATEKPKAEYYYLMGHFAGTDNSLVAYSSFLTAKSKNSSYFTGDKSAEFEKVKQSLETSFKTAIEENDKDVIKNIVTAGLHLSVTIDDHLPVVYAINIDQADVVLAFLNHELEGKTQSIITKRVQETIILAAVLDAPNTIQRFVELGFSIDFKDNGLSPIEASEKELCENSFKYLSSISSNKDILKSQFINSPIYIFITGIEDPEQAGKMIDDGSINNKDLNRIADKLYHGSLNYPHYYKIIGNSISIQSRIGNNNVYKKGIINRFLIELLEKEVNQSNAANIISSRLLESTQVPTLGELLHKSGRSELNTLFSTSEKIDFILDYYNQSIESLIDMAVNQYFSQETKDNGIKGIQNEVTRLSKIKSALPNITEEQKKGVRTSFLQTLSQSDGNMVTKRKYYNYYIKNVIRIDNYTLTEKIIADIEFFENNLSNLDQETNKVGYDATVSTIANFKKYLENVDELSSNEIHSIKSAFSNYLVVTGKELDAESLRFLLLEGYVPNKSTYYKNEYSIAFIAFKKDDPQLFKAIDDIYDLSIQTNSDGSSVFKSMLETGRITRTFDRYYGFDSRAKVELAYMSKDFDFNKKIDGQFPIEILLVHTRTGLSSSFAEYLTEELKDLTKTYNINFNHKMESLNGTILHWYVTTMINDTRCLNTDMGKFLNTLNIDKGITNSQQLTAYQYYLKNKKSIPKYPCSNKQTSSASLIKTFLK